MAWVCAWYGRVEAEWGWEGYPSETGFKAAWCVVGPEKLAGAAQLLSCSRLARCVFVSAVGSRCRRYPRRAELSVTIQEEARPSFLVRDVRRPSRKVTQSHSSPASRSHVSQAPAPSPALRTLPSRTANLSRRPKPLPSPRLVAGSPGQARARRTRYALRCRGAGAGGRRQDSWWGTDIDLDADMMAGEEVRRLAMECWHGHCGIL